MKDLTRGSLPKTLIGFAIPIFLGNLFQLFYSLADTRIVGEYLGEQALAAVGSSSILCNLMIGFVNGMTLGFAIPIARHFGAKNFDRMKKAFASSVTIGLILCVVLVSLGTIFMDQLLHFMKIDGSLIKDAGSYCTVLLFGIFFTFAYNLGASVLRAVGDSLTPLLLLICSSFINVGLDIYFINVLHLGVFGAALATVLSQCFSAVLCIFYIVLKYKILHFTWQDLRLEKKLTKELLLAGSSMAFMSSLVGFGTLMLQTAINGLGQDIIVAHTAARKATEIFMLAFSVTGATMCTFTSQNMGAARYDRIRKGTIGALLFLFAWSGSVALISFIAAKPLITMITGSTNPEVLNNASLYLRFDTSFYCVTAVITLFRNVLQGLENHVTPIISSSVELLGKTVFAKVMVPMLGYWGVILSEPVVWILMVIPLIIQIARSPYMKKQSKKLPQEA